MTDMTAILARFAMLALLLGLAGVPLYLRIAAQRSAGRGIRLTLGVVAVLAALASVWWAAASVAAMAAMPLAELDWPTLEAVLAATPLGPVLLVKLAALAAFLVALVVLPRNAALALLAAIALVSGAWIGHAGATEGDLGGLHRISDALHLLGAALWFGALLVFLTLLRKGQDKVSLIAKLEGFARTGTAVVIVLAITGGANALLIAQPGWEATSTWSLLLAAKLVLFGAMLGFAGLNRWKLTPAFAAGRPGAAGRLGMSLSLETACAVAIFALVAILGLRDPAGL